MIHAILFISGLLLAILSEIARVYFIMPFPGSQEDNTISIAYWLHQNIWLLRIVSAVLLARPALFLFRQKGRYILKIAAALGMLIWGIIAWLFTMNFMADKMFLQPSTLTFKAATETTLPGSTVIVGVLINGKAHAYPLEYIGYHHQIRDNINGIPVMITYCTVCRTGRAWSPNVNGNNEEFRLVGMDHFNAMFEDKSTGSWWRQATGQAIAGPLKGQQLREFPMMQRTLDEWRKQYPQSMIMQPDPGFAAQYERMKGYASGGSGSALTDTNPESWQKKSWIIGITMGRTSKAYDWKQLQKLRIIEDSLEGQHFVIAASNDKASFSAWRRTDDKSKQTLSFTVDEQGIIRDKATGSAWTYYGKCIEGANQGMQLLELAAYQEFWHSWLTFHPGTLQYK
jgi:hypothetical protein